MINFFTTKDTENTKEKAKRFSFVTLVSFVFGKG